MFSFIEHISFSISLTCNLTVPKQPMDGILSLDIKPGKTLDISDTDISGSMESTELLSIYVSIGIVRIILEIVIGFRSLNQFSLLIMVHLRVEQKFVLEIYPLIIRSIRFLPQKSTSANSRVQSLSMIDLVL